MVRRSSLIAIAAAGLAFVYLVPPDGSPWYPPCVFHALTGLHCPGCGTTRGLHLLLHGDLAGAFGMNPLAMGALPMLGYGLWRTWENGRTGRPLPTVLTSPRWGWTILALLLAYSVLRNLPWPPFDQLAPG